MTTPETSSNDSGMLPEREQSSILRDIAREDSDDPHVKAVCRILRDTVELPINEIHDYLEEMIPINSLFITECFVDWRIFSVVRHVLDAAKVPILQDKKTLISIKVARALYRDQPTAAEAVARVESYQRSKQTVSQPDHPTTPAPVRHITVGTGQGESHNLSRSKATVMNAFKEEDKFSGSVSGKVPLHRAKNRYLDIIRDQGIPREHEADLLHCCLKGMALDYYYKSIRGISHSAEQAFTALETRFNSLQHQAQARTYLNNLTMESIQREKECSTLEALEIAHTRITDTLPNCGREYQHDIHACDFLERIVQKQPWAERVIQDRLTPSPNERFDYNTFYSKLCAALTAWESSHRHEDSTKANIDVVGAAPTFFGEQYAVTQRPRRTPQRTRNRSSSLNVSAMIRGPNRIKERMSATKLAQIKATTRCLSCKQLGHWRHECPNRSLSPSKAVMLSLVQGHGNDDQAVAKTLWAVSEDDDEWYAYNTMLESVSPQDTTPSATGNSFEAIVNSVVPDSSYNDIEASQDLSNCFEDLANSDMSDTDQADKQEVFYAPTSN